MANSTFPGGGSVTVAAAGALTGSGTVASPLSVSVDGSTMTINGSNQLVASIPASSGRLLNVQILTASSGTYTATAGTNSVIMQIIGGGGGGGACASPTSTNTAAGQGGGGGGFIQVRFTSGFSGTTYAVGQAANGGSAGANAGTAGNNTTITVNSTAYTANGGGAGAAGTAAAAPQIFRGAFGGSTTAGDIRVSGGFSGLCCFVSQSSGVGSRGGATLFSTGAAEVSCAGTNTSSAGNNAGGYGGGGSGAIANGTGAAVAGGNGAAGAIIVYEYS